MNDGQLTLDLGHVPALGRDDFLIASCNAEAVAWLDRWPDWPSHALALWGPPGCGKTHLLSVFAHTHSCTRVTASQLTPASVPGLVKAAMVAVVDDLDGLADEAALFHLWNMTRENGRFLLLAARRAPARMTIRLPDLRSRLNATPSVGIGMADDALLAALLVKQFSDRQLKVGEGVVSYILERIERSFAAVRQVAEALDRASLAERRAITPRLASVVLEGLDPKDERQGELPWT